MRRKLLVPQMWNFTKLPPLGTAATSNVRRDGRHEADSFRNCFANSPHNTDIKCFRGNAVPSSVIRCIYFCGIQSPTCSWKLEIATTLLCTYYFTWRHVYTELTPRWFVDLIGDLNHFLQNSDSCFYIPRCLWSFRDWRWHDCYGSQCCHRPAPDTKLYTLVLKVKPRCFKCGYRIT
jgi:hypothetical protein